MALALRHWMLALGLLASLPLPAQVQIDQVRALPALPDSYTAEASFEKRIEWLQMQLARVEDPVERYRLERALFVEHFNAHSMAEAVAVCARNVPLREDIAYRSYCLRAEFPRYDDALPRLLALAEDARSLGDQAAAARVLGDLAWRQSRAGDIAGGFQNFERALSIAPADDVELLGDLMVDTAASYIVNGDRAYIRKGIDLLREARERAEQALADPDTAVDRALLRDRVLLTEFNTGIAYLLHLSDSESALRHFDRVTQEANAYREDGLVFAALSAAELGQFERARAYLDEASREQGGVAGPVVRQYLQCYRQLTSRYWDPAQPLSACLALDPETSTEVQLDVYKRLSSSSDAAFALAGLTRLKSLFIDKIEPQMRRRGSIAASHAELTRLQRESELKSLVLQQQQALQRERDATNRQRQFLFIAVSLLLLLTLALIALQWRAKKTLAEQFERLSVVDTLTGLGNRRLLEQQIPRELAQIERARRCDPEVCLGLYLFDIDHFKSINDRFGHAAGDRVLATFARRIQSAARQTDLLVRWGGEEFLLVARLERAANCGEVAERILSAVNAQPFDIDGHAPIAVTCTIGCVCSPFAEDDRPEDWADLVRLADLALYHGKANGRNRWVLLGNVGVGTAAEKRALLSADLMESVRAGRITLTTA